MYFAFGHLSDKSLIWEGMSPAVSPEPVEEQNIHPPVPLVPSLLGHVKPPSRASFTTLEPKRFFRYDPMVFMGFSRDSTTTFSSLKNLYFLMVYVFYWVLIHDIINR